MLNQIRIVFIVALMSACGTAPDHTPKFKWTGNITVQSDKFILSYNQDKFNNPVMPRVEQWWLEVQQCAGISIDISGHPLIIEYLPLNEMPEGIGGSIVLDDRFIIVLESDLRDDRAVPGQITKHEMIHYIEYLSGVPVDDIANHTSHLYGDCSGLEF